MGRWSMGRNPVGRELPSDGRRSEPWPNSHRLSAGDGNALHRHPGDRRRACAEPAVLWVSHHDGGDGDRLSGHHSLAAGHRQSESFGPDDTHGDPEPAKLWHTIHRCDLDAPSHGDPEPAKLWDGVAERWIPAGRPHGYREPAELWDGENHRRSESHPGYIHREPAGLRHPETHRRQRGADGDHRRIRLSGDGSQQRRQRHVGASDVRKLEPADDHQSDPGQVDAERGSVRHHRPIRSDPWTDDRTDGGWADAVRRLHSDRGPSAAHGNLAGDHLSRAGDGQVWDLRSPRSQAHDVRRRAPMWLR